MSDSRYSYDEKAEVWPYFAVTLIGVALVPSTWLSFKRMTSTDEDDLVKTSNKYRPENFHEIQKFKNKMKRSRVFTKTNVLIFIGWVAMAALLYLIYTQEVEESEKKLFDPYEILGIGFSATDRQIKKSYRKLSLQFHPDKLRDFGNATREELEAKYVQITKAYKSLTDEVTRDNYIKYGHPDGPQQTSHGIALPNFLVEGKGSPFTIGVYACFIGIILPYVVGSWWAGVRTYTRHGIHQKSAAIFFEACAKEQAHFINYEKILDMLSNAEEWKSLVPNSSPKYIRELIDAHLNRQPVKNESDKLTVVARCTKLLTGLLEISSAFQSAGLCQRIIEVERSIVQAVPLKDQAYGEMLQLPGISINDVGPDMDTELNQDAKLVARKTIPKLHVLKAFFRVPGEEGVIPPASQVHLVVKYVVYPYGKKLPHIPDEYLEDDDEENHNVMSEPLSTNELYPAIPPAHAPYCPVPYKPAWHGMLISERDNKIIEGVAEMDRVSYDNLNLSDEALTDPSKLTIGRFKMQITAASPQEANTYQFKLSLLNSGYFGCDIVEVVEMPVVDAPPPAARRAAEEDDDDDEVDEKGGVGGVGDGASDGEEDEEEEEDLSDIDTDTEDEAD